MNKAVASFVIHSAYDHLAYILPATSRPPTLYAGKAESLLLSLLLNILGVDMKTIPDRTGFLRAVYAFHHIWRSMDEVVDEQLYTTDPITEEDLDATLIYHKYANTLTSAAKGWQILKNAVPARFFEIAPFVMAYRSALLRVSNDPVYHEGSILPFDLAIKAKDEVTGLLGETGAQIALTLLDNDDFRIIEIYRNAGLAMQFCDDLFDWRKDWRDYLLKRQATTEHVRPLENLFLSTLTEYPSEWDKCENVLNDKRRSGYAWLKLLAPRTLKEFDHRFLAMESEIPAHPKTDFVKSVLESTFCELIPRMSDKK